ncbi:MAG: TRAP transporter permease [Clostridiales bacterium]|nr:TRAP transporter permease [Clostridiales bacterium]MDD6937373.1 TRAP transporter permease [Clostridiales bacterium]MDY2960922.1 TRAP transporter permease [Oscillospiraceae bacterium]
MSDTKKKATAAAEMPAADDMDAVMRKYDRESATRVWEGKPQVVIRVVMALFSVYCIWSTLFSTAALEIRLTAFLGLIVIMGYLTYPASKHHVKPNSLPWYDIVLMVLGAAAFFYYCATYSSLVKVLTSAAKMTPFYIAVGVVGVLCLAELCRRCVGLPILVVVGALLVYTFASMMSAGQTFLQVLGRVIYTLFYGTSGVLATPVQVCAKFIAVFIIFGAFLERTGISNFFIDLANSIAGWASGGPAKVAVISSALCGMVSGSSVGNTVTTGSVTIPMMKKTGYKPEFAGAVEAAASTGGQIMPPIMGAAAFLMAEYMGVTYGKVTLYAILPAVLYFSGIFIAVHLEAKKLGLKGIPRAELTPFRKLARDLYLLLPLIILVWMVTANVRSLQFSAAIAILVAIAVSLIGTVRDSVAAHKGAPGAAAGDVAKRTGSMILSALEAGGKGSITVAVACSMAGIIAGCITVTGLASKLISGVVAISRAIPNPTLSMLIALFLTMLCCIVLGMGVPTTANYCIMASTCAPILITLGVPKVAAHFFVFYFGIVADITPPVALAAYAGSAIAKSNPMKTGVNATKLAIAAFIVPYMFAMNPSMLLMDQGVLAAIQVIITSFLGIFGVSSALEGYIVARAPWWQRILLAAGGLSLIDPTWQTDLIGLAVIAVVVVIQIATRKNGRNTPAVA